MGTRRTLLSIICMLLLALLVVSCSSDNDDTESTQALSGVIDDSGLTEVTPTAATATATPFPEIDAATLLAETTYDMIYVHDGNLYHLTSADNPPEVIETGVHPASLAVAPDYSTMIFGLKKSEMDIQRLGILNLKTMETILVELPPDNVYAPPVVYGWSADNEWVILSFSPNDTEVIALHIPTGDYVELNWYDEGEERPHTLSTFWLTDNTILVYARRNSIGSGGVVIDVYRFDPMTGETISVEGLSPEGLGSLAIRLSVSTLNTLDGDLRTQGLELAVPRLKLAQAAYYEDMTGALTLEGPEPEGIETAACSDWRVYYKPIRQPSPQRLLYTVQDVAILSDLHPLPDESFLVTQWTLPDCEAFREEALTTALLHVHADGEVEVIAPDIEPGWVFIFHSMIYEAWPSVARGKHYAVSQDDQYVAWVRQNDTTVSLMVTDLSSNQSATIAELEMSSVGELTEESVEAITRMTTSVVMFRTG